MRWVDEAIMEAMARRLAKHPENVELRKCLVEHTFGTIKRAIVAHESSKSFTQSGVPLVRLRSGVQRSLLGLIYCLPERLIGGRSKCLRLAS